MIVLVTVPTQSFEYFSQQAIFISAIFYLFFLKLTHGQLIIKQIMIILLPAVLNILQ